MTTVTDIPDLRDLQNKNDGRPWRKLRPDEIESLHTNGNRAESWDTVLAADGFDPGRVRNRHSPAWCG